MRSETILEIHRERTGKVVRIRLWVLDGIGFSILESFLGELAAGGVEWLGRDSLVSMRGGDYEADDRSDLLSLVGSRSRLQSEIVDLQP